LLAKVPPSFDGEQQIYGALDDGSELTTRIRMTHEIATQFELPNELAARGELDPKARIRQRLNAADSLDPRRSAGSHITWIFVASADARASARPRRRG